MCFRVAQSKEFELQGDQNQAAVPRHLGIVLSQRCQLFEWAFMLVERSGERVNALPDPFLKQREKDVFLALEIGIKSAARVAGAGGDVFEAGGLKSVLGKDELSGIKELASCHFGTFRLPGGRAGARRWAHSRFFGLRRAHGKCFHITRVLCLTSYIRVCILLASSCAGKR